MQFSSLLGHTRELLLQIRSSGKPADSLIDSFFRSRKYLGSHDRRFIAETTYGTLRHFRVCEALAQSAIGDSVTVLSEEERAVFTLMTYHVRKAGNPLPETADLVPLFQAEKQRELVEGFLSRLPEAKVSISDPAGRFAIEHSLPDWLAKKLIGEFGLEGAGNLCASLNTQAPLNLRVNALKTNVAECMNQLKKEGLETHQTPHSPVGLTVPKRLNIFRLQAFRDGWFEVQDEGSQLVGVLLDPKPAWKVLDACAGAGGKTLHLAAIMKNRGEIVAADVHDVRLRELRKRAARAGASNVRMMLTDEVMSRDSFNNFFDIVFLDVPCSGTGTLRRNPGLKWTLKELDIPELKEKQIHIMESHRHFVKPGGLMFYATCSLLKDENEDVVNEFLERHHDFSPVDISGYARRTDLENFVSNGAFRLFPHVHGTDGFF
ncbi:MAG: class I SAM-dependent methyltransferase, partial [Ignavibacteriales bacterium]|nr:class I SAM-dependent methyltransferase [Ignavibacteriales bacterium]